MFSGMDGGYIIAIELSLDGKKHWMICLSLLTNLLIVAVRKYEKEYFV
jgi:hypothetical protein